MLAHVVITQTCIQCVAVKLPCMQRVCSPGEEADKLNQDLISSATIVAFGPILGQRFGQ